MNRYIAPLFLALAGMVSGCASTPSAQKTSGEIHIERVGWLTTEGGCEVRARYGGHDLRLDDFRRLEKDGVTRDGRLSLQTMFPHLSEEAAKEKIAAEGMRYVATVRAARRDRACNP